MSASAHHRAPRCACRGVLANALSHGIAECVTDVASWPEGATVPRRREPQAIVVTRVDSRPYELVRSDWKPAWWHEPTSMVDARLLKDKAVAGLQEMEAELARVGSGLRSRDNRHALIVKRNAYSNLARACKTWMRNLTPLPKPRRTDMAVAAGTCTCGHFQAGHFGGIGRCDDCWNEPERIPADRCRRYQART